jgi:hypothetical protein
VVAEAASVEQSHGRLVASTASGAMTRRGAGASPERVSARSRQDRQIRPARQGRTPPGGQVAERVRQDLAAGTYTVCPAKRRHGEHHTQDAHRWCAAAVRAMADGPRRPPASPARPVGAEIGNRPPWSHRRGVSSRP